MLLPRRSSSAPPLFSPPVPAHPSSLAPPRCPAVRAHAVPARHPQGGAVPRRRLLNYAAPACCQAEATQHHVLWLPRSNYHQIRCTLFACSVQARCSFPAAPRCMFASLLLSDPLPPVHIYLVPLASLVPVPPFCVLSCARKPATLPLPLRHSCGGVVLLQRRER